MVMIKIFPFFVRVKGVHVSDRILRGMAYQENFRFFAVDATHTVQTAAHHHHLSITATVLLGRMLCAGLLMGSDLKSEGDLLYLRVDGDGPIQGALVECKPHGRIRGYVMQPEVELSLDEKTGAIQVGKALGKGVLTIIRDLGCGNPYQGQTLLQTSEIAEDIAYYYVQSEQINTAVSLGVLVNPDASVKRAGGFLIQALPNATEEAIAHLEKNIQAMPYITDLLDMGMSINDICTNILFKGMDCTINEELDAAFECSCSKDNFARGLRLLAISELEEMLSEPVVTRCRFCNTEYTFSIDEIAAMIKEKQE
jgi:molecular chaperone Hsp33